MGASFKMPQSQGDYTEPSKAGSSVNNSPVDVSVTQDKSNSKPFSLFNAKGKPKREKVGANGKDQTSASLIEKSFVSLTVEHKFYRTTIISNAGKNIEQTFSERRVSWMNVCKIVLTVCFAIPVSMFHWRYQAWGIYFLISLSGLFAWDYISHIRQMVRAKALVDYYAIDNCRYESKYLTKRPDKIDLVAPYLIFTILSLLVITFFEVSIKYSEEHKDSSLIKMIDNASASAGEHISKVTRGNMKYMNN